MKHGSSGMAPGASASPSTAAQPGALREESAAKRARRAPLPKWGCSKREWDEARAEQPDASSKDPPAERARREAAAIGCKRRTKTACREAASASAVPRTPETLGDRGTAATKVAYIYPHGEFQRISVAVEDAINVGAVVVNLSFSKTEDEGLADTGAVLPDLQNIFDANWTSPYSWRECGSVVSFFLHSCGALVSDAAIDPEGALPALSLTFKTPSGELCVVTTSVPALSAGARGRLLNTYANYATAHLPRVTLIGGFFADPAAFVENQINNLDSDFELFANANLCLLAHHPGLLEPGDFCNFVSYPLGTDGPFSLIAEWRCPCSAGQPAEPTAGQPAVTLRRATPLYDNLMARLEPAVRQHPSGEAFMCFMTQCCFCDELLLKDPFGNDLDRPVPISWKMEQLLGTCRKQRQLQLERIGRRGPRKPAELKNLHLGEEEMEYIYNTWRKDVQSWMREDAVARHGKVPKQQARQIEKHAFDRYLFYLSGCKFLLHALIRLPIIHDSVEQPVSDGDEEPVDDVLCAFIKAYEDHKRTPDYRQAAETFIRKVENQRRLDRRIWWAQYNYQQGKQLSFMVKDFAVDFHALTTEEQSLVEDFDTRRAGDKLDRLVAQKRGTLGKQPPGDSSVVAWVIAEQNRMRLETDQRDYMRMARAARAECEGAQRARRHWYPCCTA